MRTRLPPSNRHRRMEEDDESSLDPSILMALAQRSQAAAAGEMGNLKGTADGRSTSGISDEEIKQMEAVGRNLVPCAVGGITDEKRRHKDSYLTTNEAVVSKGQQGGMDKELRAEPSLKVLTDLQASSKGSQQQGSSSELSDSAYLMRLLARRSHIGDVDDLKMAAPPTSQPAPSAVPQPPTNSTPVQYDNRGRVLKTSSLPLDKLPGAYRYSNDTPGGGYSRREPTQNLSAVLGNCNCNDESQAATVMDNSGGTERTSLDASCHRVSWLSSSLGKGQSFAQREARKRQCRIAVAILVVMCVIGAALLVAIFVGGMDDEEASSNIAYSGLQTAMPQEALNFRLIPNLPNYTLEAIVNDASSPQAQAFEWISKDPTWHTYEDWRKQQRFALTTLYFAFGGPPLIVENARVSTHKVYWMRHYSDECDRSQVHKLLLKDPCPDGDGVVRALSFGKISRVRGSVPPEIALLSHLEVLDLSRSKVYNDLETLLPLANNVDSFPSLRELSLSDCQLYGSLPSSLGQLKSLTHLDLSDNDLNSTIPSEFGQLSNLTSLLLSSNALSGSIPYEIGDISSLTGFDVEMNPEIQRITPDGFCVADRLPMEVLRTDWCSNAQQCCDSWT